jgi:hypothetical protein
METIRTNNNNNLLYIFLLHHLSLPLCPLAAAVAPLLLRTTPKLLLLFLFKQLLIFKNVIFVLIMQKRFPKIIVEAFHQHMWQRKNHFHIEHKDNQLN